MKGCIINKLTIGIMIGCIPCSLLAADGRTTFQYEHKFKTTDRRHHDTLKLIHKTPELWHFEVKFGTSAGSSRNYDVAYDDMQGGSGGLVLQKDFRLLERRATLTPSMEFAFGNTSLTYQPGARLSYSINKEWSVYGRYRYELKKLTRDYRYNTISQSDKYGHAGEVYRSRSDTGRHRLDSGVSYSGIPHLQLSYVFNYFIGDNINDSWSYKNGVFTANQYAVYNGKKTDTEQQFKIAVRYFKQFRPYLEVDDVTVSGNSKSRQQQYKIGFNYLFD